jgi:hypothetical protein
VIVRVVTRDADGNPVPALPAGWVGYHDGISFAVLRREADGAYMFCAVLADGAELDPPDEGRAVFLAVDPTGGLRAPLRGMVGGSSLAWTPAGLRADQGAAAVRVKAAIRDTRPRDDSGDPIGELVELRTTVAGYDLRGASENVTDLGDL